MVTLTKDPSPPASDIIAGEVTTKQHNALIDRVGGEHTKKIDVRIITATIIKTTIPKRSRLPEGSMP